MKIKNIIKLAYVSLGSESDSNVAYPSVQITYHDIPRESLRASIYGLVSSPPKNSMALTFAAYGQESTLFSFSDDYINRFKGLKIGEVLTGNYSTGSYTYYDNNGNAKVFSANATASLVGSKVYLGTSSINILEKIIGALDILLQATYPSAVGPAGPIASPFKEQLEAIKTELEGINGDYQTEVFDG